MSRLLRLWFGLTEPVPRLAYALSGFGLMGLKYAVEAAVIHQVTGSWLTPLDYFTPLLASRQAAVGQSAGLLVFVLAWTLPFVWIGVSMTVRRGEDAGWPPVVTVPMFFMPFVNYLFMLALCVLPSRAREAMPAVPAAEGRDATRSALLGVGLGVLIAVIMVGLSVLVFGAYGTTLFVATPFVMGATAAFVYNAGAIRTTGATMGVAALSVLAACGVILLLAVEGIVCLFMAAPPAMVMALMGSWLGRALAQQRAARTPGLASMLLPLPLLAGMESGRPAAPPAEVVTVVEIAAPAETVWRHVVTFSELREAPAWFFRLGIAYPRRATIAGRGVGAQRRCEFSTGAFVEPVTVWDEPRRLAFDVAAQPPALSEWSPYRGLAPPHLDGYLRVRNGEFRLTPLAGGRTRLEGRTRYDLRLFPATYWRLWADALIHRIHERVLAHIRTLAESGASG